VQTVLHITRTEIPNCQQLLHSNHRQLLTLLHLDQYYISLDL